MSAAPQGRPVAYIALGDSYTAGIGATSASRSFPSQLATRLEETTGKQVALANPAEDGFTSDDLIRNELQLIRIQRPDLVTVLIGANDIAHGRSSGGYRMSLRHIYDAIGELQLPSGRVVAISIPDWSWAPAARRFGSPERLRDQIDHFNGIGREEAQERWFTWIDISELSRSRRGEGTWISRDRLHPSDRQYRAWVEHIWDAVRDDWVNV
jgi:lysophospholipase L1-like esterase